MRSTPASRVVVAVHLLIAFALLATLVWRLASWSQVGWSGLHFSGPESRRAGMLMYSIWPQYKAGTVFRVPNGGPADRAGIERNDVVESVNGVSLDDPRFARATRNVSPGEAIRYWIRNKQTGTTAEKVIRLESPLRNALVVSEITINIVLALFYIAVSGLLAARKWNDRQVRIFSIMAVVGASAFFIEGLMSVDRATSAGVTTLLRSGVSGMGRILELYLLALLFHFTFIFPRLRPAALNPRKWRWWLALIYAAPTILAIGQLGEMLAPEWPLWIQLTAGFVQIMVALPMVIGFPWHICANLAKSYKESSLEERKQIRWPVWGTFLAIALPVGISFAFGVWSSFPPELRGRTARSLLPLVEVYSDAFFLLIPIAFAIGITKYKLMQIDRLLEKTTVYGIVTLVLLGVFFILAGGLGAIVVRATNLRNEWVIIISTLTVASLLLPVRSRVQKVVERKIFPRRFSYPEALAGLHEVCRTAHEPRDMTKRAVEVIQQATASRFTVLLLRQAGTNEMRPAATVGIPDETVESLRADAERFRSLQTATPSGNELPPIDAALIAPLRRETKLIGVMAIGRRIDGEEYDDDDARFLMAASEEIALGLSRIELHRGAEEFDEARAIQSGLVPKIFPRIDGFDIAGAWVPARVVGGDYFDVITLDDSTVALCIADVVGKGIPAALLMSNLQATVRAFASPSPADLCKRLHTLVRNNVSMGRFVTFFYATLDTRTRRIRYCNAGHNPPLLIRAEETKEELSAGGPALGAFKAAEYRESSIELAPGDRLILFTDGVTEAAAGEEQFGEQRLVDLIRSRPHDNAAELQRTIVEKVKIFSAGVLQDDVTLLLLVAHDLPKAQQ